MSWTLVLGVTLAWGAIAAQSAAVYLLLRRYGRVLLTQDELDGKISSADQAFSALAEKLGDKLDAVEAAVRAIPSNPPQTPQELPLGSLAPAFRLRDIDGRERTLQEFLDRPRVLIFYSPECGYCSKELAPRLREFPAGGADVVLVSRGNPEDHRRWAEEHGWQCEVLLQDDWEVFLAYHAQGTPSGYLVDTDGRIASSQIVGTEPLLDLARATASVRTNQRSNGNGNGHDEATTKELLREKAAIVAERARAAGLGVRDSQLNRTGLPAGTPAPDFRLPDLDGVEHELKDYRGKRVVLVFSDPDCGPCQTLAPALEQLHQVHRENNLQMIMLSRGAPDVNRMKANEHGLTFPVLLQRHWEVSKDYAMFATPVAYLIDERGNIAHDVALGPTPIVELAQLGAATAVAQVMRV